MKTVLLIVLTLCFSAANGAEIKSSKPERVGMSGDRLERIKPVMQKYVDEGKLAGIVTLIARKGKVVHFEKVGKLNLETGEEIELDSLFRIYSMTKPIVTSAAMMLYEEGKFLLDDPVSKYLPTFNETQVLVEPEHAVIDR